VALSIHGKVGELQLPVVKARRSMHAASGWFKGAHSEKNQSGRFLQPVFTCVLAAQENFARDVCVRDTIDPDGLPHLIFADLVAARSCYRETEGRYGSASSCQARCTLTLQL
jgi:hypothetical protein